MSDLLSEEDVDYFFRFMGYGPLLTAKVWFIGIEEGGEMRKPLEGEEPFDKIEIDGEVLNYEGNSNLSSFMGRPKKEISPVWEVGYAIARDLELDDTKYVFIGNMAPFARTKEIAEHKFGTPADYNERVKKKYIERRYRLWKRLRPKAVVFHGAGAFRDYGVAEVFGLKSPQQDPAGLNVYELQKIIQTKSFSRAFPIKADQAIVARIREWLKD